MASKGKQRTSAVTAPELHPVQAKPLWENNEIQFARLIMEICANVTMVDDEIQAMRASMDLGQEDFDELWERAHDVWETAKGNR